MPIALLFNVVGTSNKCTGMALLNETFGTHWYQIKSVLLVYGAVKTTIYDQVVVWVYGKGH